ncbi:MAG: hypothetical protein Q9170_005342 [Blastenia crenularia]
MTPSMTSKFTLEASIGLLLLSILICIGSSHQQTSIRAIFDHDSASSIQKIVSITDDQVLPRSRGSHHFHPHHHHQHQLRHETALGDNLSNVYPGKAHSLSTDETQPVGNRTTVRHSIAKRADEDDDDDNGIDLELYRCKGERYLANMRAATAKPPKWSFGNLAENGWKVKPGDQAGFPQMLQRALTDLHVFPPVGKHYDVKVALEATNLQQPRGNPYYDNWYILPRVIGSSTTTSVSSTATQVPGAIIGALNYGPKFYANELRGAEDPPIVGDALESLIPQLNSWADVVWAMWKQTAGDQAGDLRYIFHNFLSTKTTQLIIEAIEGRPGEDIREGWDLPYPGQKYKIDSPNGLALLGSPHGVGISWLYVNGRADLGVRNEITVSIFSGMKTEGDDDGYFKYYMVWDLGSRS